MDHRAEERMPFRGAKKSWAGTIRCTCGWEGEVADHPDEASAVVGARAIWILHCFDVTAPVHVGAPSPERREDPEPERRLVALEASDQ